MKNIMNKVYWILTVGMCIILIAAFVKGYRALHETVEVDEPVEVVEEVAETEEVLDDGVLVLEETPSEAPESPVSNEKKSKKKDKPVVKSEPVDNSDEPVVETFAELPSNIEIEGEVIAEPEPVAEREITGTLLGSDFTLTHYAPTGNATASGRMPEVGITVAVDKKYIKLGTRLRIEIPDGNGGYKVYQDNCRADDTGRLIKGHKIDVFVASESEARQRGVIRNARVYILD